MQKSKAHFLSHTGVFMLCAAHLHPFWENIPNKKHNMNTQILVHTHGEIDASKEVVERIVGLNIDSKLSSYLEKFSKQDSEGRIEVHVEKNKKGLFDGKVQANLDGKAFRFEREDYKKSWWSRE